MEKSQICDETISLILRSCYRDVSRESIVNKNARYPRCSFSRTASSRGSVGAILRRAIRCRLSWLHSVFIADASARCKVHANTLYVTTKPIYFPRANSQRNTRGDVIDRDAGEPFRLRLVLYNFPKNPCPRIELSYPPAPSRVSSHVSCRKIQFSSPSFAALRLPESHKGDPANGGRQSALHVRHERSLAQGLGDLCKYPHVCSSFPPFVALFPCRRIFPTANTSWLTVAYENCLLETSVMPILKSNLEIFQLFLQSRPQVKIQSSNLDLNALNVICESLVTDNRKL